METKLLDYYIQNFILTLKPRRHNIFGAPFKIGDKVKVLNNPNHDVTFNEEFSELEGVVVHFEYDGGCCQTYPYDPMIGVRLSNNILAEFWKEELLLLEK